MFFGRTTLRVQNARSEYAFHDDVSGRNDATNRRSLTMQCRAGHGGCMQCLDRCFGNGKHSVMIQSCRVLVSAITKSTIYHVSTTHQYTCNFGFPYIDWQGATTLHTITFHIDIASKTIG